MPWDFHSQPLPAYPPAGQEGFISAGTDAFGREYALFRDYRGHYTAFKLNRHGYFQVGGVPSAPDVAQQEAAATGSAATQTSSEKPAKPKGWLARTWDTISRGYVTTASYVQKGFDAVASSVDKNWSSHKAKIKRTYEGTWQSNWGRIAGIFGFALGLTVAGLSGMAALTFPPC